MIGKSNSREHNYSKITNNISEVNRYVMKLIHSNMYVLIEDDCALVIDPNNSKQAIEAMNECGVENVTVLLTHEHIDHTCGLINLKDCFKAVVVCTKACAEFISVLKNNRPLALMGLVGRYGREAVTDTIRSIKPFACEADITFGTSYEFTWRDHFIRAIITPGHSLGGCCYELDSNCVFTGDVLVPEHPVLTRFPGGSIDEYEGITLPYFKSMDDEMTVYPGHGEPCKRQELFYNNCWYLKIK